MSILITGVCGFIGSNLANTLIEKGDRIIGVDNLSRGSLQNIAGVKDNLNFHLIETNICNYRIFSEKVSVLHKTYPITEVWH